MAKIETKLHPAFFIHAVLDKSSGILEINMVTTAAILAVPPVIIVRSIAIDSGMPSIIEPTTMAKYYFQNILSSIVLQSVFDALQRK